MASVEAAINIVVNGQQKVDQLIQNIDKVANRIAQINRDPIALSAGGTERAITRQAQALEAEKKRLAKNRLDAENAAAKAAEKYTTILVKQSQIIQEAESRGGRAVQTKKYTTAVEKHRQALLDNNEAQEKYAQALEEIAKAEATAEKAAEKRIAKLEKGKTVIAQLDALTNKFLTNTKVAQESRSAGFVPAQIKETIQLFKELAANVDITSTSYRKFTLAGAAASIQSGREQNERLRILADTFRDKKNRITGGAIQSEFGGIDYAGVREAAKDLINAFPKIARSQAGLEEYRSQLDAIRRLTPIAGENFIRLGNVIREVDNILLRVSEKKLPSNFGPAQEPKPMGPSIDLESTVRVSKEKLNYEKAVSRELDKQIDLKDQINKSSVDALTKSQLNARVEKTLSLLTAGRLEDSRDLTREIAKQLSRQEKNLRPTTTTVGALGTGFMPVSGVLPNKSVAPGSPAAEKMQREFASAKLDVLERIKRVQDEINTIMTTEAEKQRLTKQLAASRVEIEQGRLDVAEKIAKQTLSDARTSRRNFKDEQIQSRLLENDWEKLEKLITNAEIAYDKFKQNIEDIELFPAASAKKAQEKLDAADFDSRLKIQDKITESTKALPGQLKELEILQNNWNKAKQKGVAFTNEDFQSLQNVIDLLKSPRFTPTATSKEVVDTIIGSLKRTGRLRVSQTPAGAGGAGADVANETRLSRILENTFRFRGEIAKLQAKGIDLSVQRAAIEQEILNIQQLQGSTTKEQNQIAAQNVQAIRTAVRDIATSVEQASKLTGFGAKFANFQESLSASRSYFGAKGPEQAISDIVKAFNERRGGTAATGGAGANVVNTLATEVQSGIPKANAAGIQLGKAVEKGLNDGLDINSPSGVALRAAMNLVNTFISAIQSGQQRLNAALEKAFRPNEGKIKTEFEQMFEGLKSQMAGLTSNPYFYGRLLKKLPDEAITTTMAGAASDVYAGRQLPGGLENQIKQAYFNSFGKIPSFFDETVGAILQRLKAIPSRLGFGAGSAGGGGRPPGGTGGTTGAPEPGDFSSRLNQAAEEGVQALLGLRELREPTRASIADLELLSAVLKEVYANLDPTAAGFDRLEKEIRQTVGRLDEFNASRQPDADPLVRAVRSPRRAQAISEGLIGGAFPLLFGQGVGASVLGGIGGAAGGYLGGSLGFGLSLIGTAVGSAFDTLGQKAIELGGALNDTSKTFDIVKERSLFSSKELERAATRLQEAGLVASASGLAQQEIFKKVGLGGIRNLEALATESDRLNRAWSELSLQIQAATAGPLAGLLEWVSSVVNVANQQFRRENKTRDIFESLSPEQQKLFNEKVKQRVSAMGQVGLAAPVDGSPAAFEIGASTEEYARIRAQIANEFANGIDIKFNPKITRKQKIESDIALLSKNLEVIDIGKQFSDQVKAAAREQKDLDRQRADIVRSYEESLGEIRKKVEDEVQRRRFSVLEKENQLLDIQGQNRIKQLQLANLKFISQAGAGDTPEIEKIAKEAAAIVAEFTEQQVSAEEEAAKIKRNAALQARMLDFEGAKFKAGIEKEVSKLNIETARRVSGINENIRKRNEDSDTRRFDIEKQIAILRLDLIAEQYALLTHSPGIDKVYYEALIRNIEIMRNNIREVKKMQPLPELGPVNTVKMGPVSFRELNAAISNESEAIRSLVEEELNGIEIGKKINTESFKQKMLGLTKDAERPLSSMSEQMEEEEKRRMRYTELVRQGRSADLANQIIEIENATKLVDLGYLRIISLLEEQKVRKGISKEVRDQIDLEIERIRVLRGELPGKKDKATKDAEKGESFEKKIGDEINTVQVELDKLLDPANQLITIADSIGTAFSESFKGVISGSMTAKEALANFFQSTANAFLDMAAQIIQKWVVVSILKSFNGGAADGAVLGAPSIPSITPNAVGNIYARNNIVPFANGGSFTNSIVQSPTLFKFADGVGLSTGVMGEAGPEAIMPLRRGRNGKLGVEASGSGASSVEVTVNVDAKGTSVQGDSQAAGQLGRVIAGVVRQELINQQRQGGLLNR